MSASPDRPQAGRVVALSGGIGGAKLAWGLAQIMRPADLMVVANTGDDFEHLGLSISPDIDTLVYTLAGLNNRELGWGMAGETWTFMEALKALGGETWFKLGDGDLAMHVERTRRLKAGESLTAVTDSFCRALGIAARIVPMSDDPVRTRVRTEAGWLDFQDYFVGQQCAPAISDLAFDGAAEACIQPEVLAALRDPGLSAVIVCPSNPFISIGPILAMPGMREALEACTAPIVAVSPIIGGKAVKGPTAKMMAELGLPVTSGAACLQYAGLLDAVLVDAADAGQDHGAPVVVAPTLMTSDADKVALARRVMDAAAAVVARRCAS